MGHRSELKYKRLFAWWDAVEGRITRILLFCMLALIVVQLLHNHSAVRGILNQVERLEGKSVFDSHPDIKTGLIELTGMDTNEENKLTIILNGVEVGELVIDPVEIEVKNSDIIEISGIGCKRTVRVKATKLSPNVLEPGLNKSIVIRNNLVKFASIKLK